MSQRIFRIVYCSRHRLQGPEAEWKAQLSDLLRVSRRHNAQAGVTGALFFNTVYFAQVLEGDYVHVQRVFQRAQLDGRHSHLVILQCGYAAGRDFGDWSMAYAGASARYRLPFGEAPQHEAALTGTSHTGEAVLRFLRDIVVQQQVWALPEPAHTHPVSLSGTGMEAIPVPIG